jgi:excisionase family DNA binding protein
VALGCHERMFVTGFDRLLCQSIMELVQTSITSERNRMQTSLGATLTPREAAAALRCSPASIYRAVHAGELEAVRLGRNGSFRIRQEALSAFVRPVRAENARG